MNHWSRISHYFTQKELISPDLRKYHYMIDPFFVFMLNLLRRRVDMPLVCNYGKWERRGTRSARETIRVHERDNGALLSMHSVGRAADLHTKPKNQENKALLVATANEMHFWVREYDWGVHVDIRNIEVYVNYAEAFGRHVKLGIELTPELMSDYLSRICN